MNGWLVNSGIESLQKFCHLSGKNGGRKLFLKSEPLGLAQGNLIFLGVLLVVIPRNRNTLLLAKSLTIYVNQYCLRRYDNYPTHFTCDTLYFTL